MPTPNLPYIQFIGGRSDPKRQEYLNTLLKATGVPDGVKQILVESPIGMRQARQMYQVPDNRPAFSSYQDGRVYIDDNTLDNPKMIHDYLLHEFGHFAAKAYPKKGNEDRLSNNQMQAMEQAAEKGAQPYRDAFKLFQSKAGRAYQAEQSRIDSDQGKIQSTPAPVNTSFENSLSPRVQNIMAQQPSRSYAQRVIAQQPVSSLRMADRMKLQSPETGK